MRSYTQLRATYGVDTKNAAAANLLQGDEWMNDFHRRLLVKADWPFLRRLRFLSTLAPDSTFTAVAASDVCTAVSNAILTDTGTQVKLTTTDTLPAGLSTSTKYFMVYQSATTFKLATSLANAQAGTIIDITGTGTGTHTVVIESVSNFQPLPYDIDLVESVFVTVSSTRYNPKPAPSRIFWDKLHYSTITSDTPEWWFVENGKFALWPRPSTAGNQISISGKIRVQDLNSADYTTGTVDIAPNGSILITGDSTVWTSPMTGRWIRITYSDVAAASGDGQWYEITSVPSSTTLTIARPYGGTSLTTGATAAYIIGQMPSLPEAFQALPEHYAAFRYWTKEKDSERVSIFKTLVNEGVPELFSAYGVNDLSMVIDDGEDATILNPNLTITL